MTSLTRRSTLVGMGALLAAPAHAERYFMDSTGHALKGYDTVSFFVDKTALRGKFDLRTQWQGASWQFSSQKNLDLFKKSPEDYQIEFGGYCAWAMSRGFKQSSDPKLWVNVNGRIFMHYTVRDQNLWAKDIRGNIAAADENWKTVKAY